MLDSLDILIGFALIFTVVSLLVTIVVQMITSAMNLRGRNLAWGVAETFEAIEPELAAKTGSLGKRVADHVLKDPLLSDNQIFLWCGRTTAVRPEELFDLLHRIASGRKKVNDAKIQAGVKKLFARLGLSEAELNGNSAASPLRALVEAMPDGLPKIEAMAALVAAEASAATKQVQAKLTTAYHQFESWLRTGQERAQEWFKVHAQVVTLFVGAAFAFGLQLDTIEIFKMVSTNRALRNQLVTQTNSVLGHAEKVLQASPDSVPAALGDWQKTMIARKDDAFGAALKAKPLAPISGETREALRRRLEQEFEKETKTEEGRKALFELEAAIDKQAKNDMRDLGANYLVVKGDLDATGFALFPPGWARWKGETWRERMDGHWMGVLFSVLLLSLGAPFWFNLLKSLASLRSSVANNIASESKADQKRETPTAAAPPPTVVPSS